MPFAVATPSSAPVLGLGSVASPVPALPAGGTWAEGLTWRRGSCTDSVTRLLCDRPDVTQPNLVEGWAQPRDCSQLVDGPVIYPFRDEDCFLTQCDISSESWTADVEHQVSRFESRFAAKASRVLVAQPKGLADLAQPVNSSPEGLSYVLGLLMDRWFAAGGASRPILHAPHSVYGHLVEIGLAVAANGSGLLAGTRVHMFESMNVWPTGGTAAPPGSAWVYLSGEVQYDAKATEIVNLGKQTQSNMFDAQVSRVGIVLPDPCGIVAGLVCLPEPTCCPPVGP